MNVDHPKQILGHEIRAQDLHVTSEHNQVDALTEQLEHFLFTSTLVLGVGQGMERDVVEVSEALGRRVIADDHYNVAGEFPHLMPVQEVGETMLVSGNQNRDFGSMLR